MSARTTILAMGSALLIFSALLSHVSPAMAAEGVLIAPGHLGLKDRTALSADIQAAKSAHPSAFTALSEVRKQLPAIDANKRGRLAAVTPMLRSIGAEGLYPMLAEIAVDAQAKGDLSDSAWKAWRIGLLEAVGSLRDPRSEPVLAAVLNGPENDFAIVKAAASAFGKIGSDRVAARLIAMSKVEGPKQKAIWAGMGDCRRTKIASALAAALASKPEENTAKLLIKSLGDVGSAWAWKTPVIAVSGEEVAVRKTAAKALIDAFVSYDSDLRTHIGNAILVVDDPSTTTLIESAKQGASPSLLSALDRLSVRVANSPLH